MMTRFYARVLFVRVVLASAKPARMLLGFRESAAFEKSRVGGDNGVRLLAELRSSDKLCEKEESGAINELAG